MYSFNAILEYKWMKLIITKVFYILFLLCSSSRNTFSLLERKKKQQKNLSPCHTKLEYDEKEEEKDNEKEEEKTWES